MTGLEICAIVAVILFSLLLGLVVTRWSRPRLPRAPFVLPEPTRIPPMPEIASALVDVPDLMAAVKRLSMAWNRYQAIDACRSVRYYLEEIERGIEKRPPTATPPTTTTEEPPCSS